MSAKSIIVASPIQFDQGAATEPVSPQLVKTGIPIMRTWRVVRSHDLTSDVVVWECSAGVFECRYSQDETLMVISGEAFIRDEKGQERRLGPGDLGFFPAGTSCIWRVPDRVRKIAVLRETVWRPMGFGVKVWKRLVRIVGRKPATPAGAA